MLCAFCICSCSASLRFCIFFFSFSLQLAVCVMPYVFIHWLPFFIDWRHHMINVNIVIQP